VLGRCWSLEGRMARRRRGSRRGSHHLLEVHCSTIHGASHQSRRVIRIQSLRDRRLVAS
jgi:hypothetical protein